MEPFGAFFGTKCTPYLEARQKARSGVKGLKSGQKMCGNYSPTNAVTRSLRKGIKQKIEHGISCYIEDSIEAVDLHRSK